MIIKLVYLGLVMVSFCNSCLYDDGLYVIKKPKDDVFYLAFAKNNQFYIRKFKGGSAYNEDINGEIEKLARLTEE
jgi:hypothetical protein